MASGGEDFYSVLGVKKECTVSELRNAYKKLAMRWHPDRCSASGNSKFIEESKKKFQSIQEAYSVLSNANKRFMYDLGLYKNDDDDDDDNEMGDFLGEMVDLMAQTKPNENAKAETFEDLQVLFEADGGLDDSRGRRGSSKRRTVGKQKSSSQHNMSSHDSKISV
ncbi:uncharacterized protein LOC113341793 isoform X2 [Papaver somniferum]|uniref:uncharacterized protein LOC113341793 isoform X2 n=1 Tax=Papaver somniferum TaxID=3469 RepID=UPI000E705FB9|nr:uncharacterized protein LOC113341793 isoform X2 [Papaver somniferum]